MHIFTPHLNDSHKRLIEVHKMFTESLWIIRLKEIKYNQFSFTNKIANENNSLYLTLR